MKDRESGLADVGALRTLANDTPGQILSRWQRPPPPASSPQAHTAGGGDVHSAEPPSRPPAHPGAEIPHRPLAGSLEAVGDEEPPEAVGRAAPTGVTGSARVDEEWGRGGN